MEEKQKVPQVGMKVTVCLWSDRRVHTITWVSRTQRRMLIQRDKVEAVHSKEDLGWVPGGFSAVATKQDRQKWKCTPDPEGPSRNTVFGGMGSGTPTENR